MELSLRNIIDFVVTSGLYLVIIGNLFRVIKNKNSSNKKKYSDDTAIPNMKNEKRNDNQTLYTEEPRKGMKKQSVFTSMMQQVDKISESFETKEKSWSKGQKSTNANMNVEYPVPEKNNNQVNNNQKNRNPANTTIKQSVMNSKIYEPIGEINDMKDCIHEDRSIILKFKKNEMKKAIIMKELLDKPLAYRRARR